jgi:CheY-like chemotaxis protein/signal transduction histidine kinase
MRPEVLTILLGFVGLAALLALGLVLPRVRGRRPSRRIAESPAQPVSEPMGSLLSASIGSSDDYAAAQRVRDGERADQLRNLLLSKMSHDIRTPLNSVITLSQLLVDGSAGRLAFEQRKYLEVIHRNGQALLSLFNDIVDLSSLEAGRLEIEYAPVDLRPLLQTVSDAVTPLARKKSLPLHVNVPRKMITARADEERLRQLLTNIVEHAIGQTDNGYVELSAESDGGRAIIRISDTGVAMNKLARGALFDDFLTGLGPFVESGEGRGSGLGLVVAGRLIKLMGGEIAVDSMHGEGTTFTISLPLPSDEGAVRPATKEPIAADITGGHVLLIEDDEIERRRVGAALERAGFDVVLAASGQEGLTLLREGHFDAVVLDLVMPGMSGLDVLRSARADDRLANTPIVVLSALYMSKSERDVLGPGVAGVVRKGETTAQELTTHLRQAIQPAGGKSHRDQILSMMRPAQVLVVDDNADNLFAIKQILASLPVTVETATSGPEAIECCRRHRPDVIMMDVQLPGLSGLEASRAIRELPDCRNIPIIALTAEAMQGDRERVMAAQCSDYLAKPVQPVDVVSAVTRALQIQFH